MAAGSLNWIDRYSERTFGITTSDESSRGGVARVKTYGEVIEDCRLHPEHKSLGLDGDVCQHATSGVLARRPIEAIRLRYVGKEANRLVEVEHGLIEDEDEILNEHDDPANDPFDLFVVSALARVARACLVAESSLHVRTRERLMKREQQPHKRTRDRLTQVAAHCVRETMKG